MKKTTVYIVLFCLIMSLLSACAGSSAQDDQRVEYSYYTEIPGVTQEDIDAVEALKADRDLFRFAMTYSTEIFQMDDGSFGGFTRRYCDWLSGLFGIPFEPEICEWIDLIPGLQSHKFDFTGDLTKSEERLEAFFMTDAIAQRSIKAIKRISTGPLSEMAEDGPLRYIFINGANTNSYLEAAATEEYTYTYVDSFEDAALTLMFGRADAFIGDGTAEAAFVQYINIAAEQYFPLIYSPVSLSTANPELEPIINIMQKCLDSGAIYTLSELYSQGEHDYLKYRLDLYLTNEEKEYIHEHGSSSPIMVAAELENYPVSFYNNQENAFQGIALDVLDEISVLTGLSFEIASKPGMSWADIQTLLDNKDVSFVTELIRTNDREGEYFWPEESFSSDNYALLSRTDRDSISINQISLSTVAVVANSAYERVFRNWFPLHDNIIPCENMNACFDVLRSGEADLLMASQGTMLSLTNYEESHDIKVNMLFDTKYESYFGFNSDEELLCSIVSKAQALVDTDRIVTNWTHKVFDYEAAIMRERMPYLAGLAGLLGLVLVLSLILLRYNARSAKELEELVHQRTGELEVQTHAAQAASRSKSEFLSRMSHEIRTPLNAIIGMTQLSLRIPDMPDKAQDASHAVLTASSHLLDILNDVLDMSKIEAGKFALSEEPFALNPTMDEVYSIIAQRCIDKDINFVTNHRQLPELFLIGDRLRLKQVLINLLGNAVKFTDAGGRIRFAVDVEAETSDNVRLAFMVEDDGIGMTEEQTSRLFRAFEQANSSVASKYGGTGLGLAISQNMVSFMGGEIIVKSAPGEGSSFSFSISLAKTDGVSGEHDANPAPKLHGRRMLLAEDVEINRIVLMGLLEDTGIEIDEAVDGAEALSKFSDSPLGYYDIILMDVQMPSMDGYTATGKIRELPRADAKTIPIIATTANAYKDDIDRALASGMNAHVSKPIDISAVYDVFGEYL